MITSEFDDAHTASSRDLALDLTPMLDILFILLVFFLLTAGSILQKLDLQLPSSVSEAVAPVNAPKHILLEIRDGSYALNGEEVTTFKVLKSALDGVLKSKPDHDVIVAGDKRVAIEELLRVLTFLQSRGVSAANILMQSETEK
ncbi:MAG: biopolymer transporter ExbD [Alphaproteobacteria bacterium]|nr:biopolymer transporter ExbD [Alphaproteobacteria bacterium]